MRILSVIVTTATALLVAGSALGQTNCIEMQVSGLVAGQEATWDISGAPPFSSGVVVWGTRAGSTVVNGNFGYCATFDIDEVNQNRVVGHWEADGSGVSRVVRLVHYSLAGRTIHTQAAVRFTCPDECMSDVDEQTIP